MPSGQKCNRSLAQKYSWFTIGLVVWIVLVFLVSGWRAGSLGWVQITFAAVVLPLAGVALSRFTAHVLGRPLIHLQEGITSVQQGRLETIHVSKTGDELQFLGDSLNAMIDALRSSREELREYQDLLEERIRQRTEALEEATQKALSASRAKSEFLANISHELRTPMNGVLGMLDIVLDEGKLEPDQREQLEMAKNCAHTLLALLNDLLDLSKIEAGKMLLEHIPFDLRSVAADCVTAVLPRARQKGVVVRKRVSGDLPALVQGDPLRVRQILTNLLGNAVKFTDEGTVDLVIEVTTVTQNAASIRMAVKDTGKGIEKEKLATIFEQFSQADGSISRRYGGTGLGLAITRRLVEMHGGTIRVESEPGCGSTFEVIIPLGLEAAEPAPAVSSPRQTFEPPKPPARILVVEDNTVNQRVTSSILRKAGFAADVVGSGAEALQALAQHAYRLVLMDLQMPGMDGISAVRKIREQEEWRDLPIIAMTAHVLKGDRERCLAAGMNGYLSKPVAPQELVEVVRGYVEGSIKPVRRAVRAAAGAPMDELFLARMVESEPQLVSGMILLFLELWPERLEKLQAAAVRGDSVSVRNQALKLQKAAARIAAPETARVAGAIADAAATEGFPDIQRRIEELRTEIARLDAHIRSQEPLAIAG